MTRTDWVVGKLVAELEAQGVADSTYVIYLSDNGRPFPRCKTYLYDSGIKTPLIIWNPGSIRGGRTDALVSSIDLAPTILELAGLKVDSRVQGVSFEKVLQDPAATVRDYVFAEHNWHVYQNHERLVRSDRFAYIRNAWPDRRVLCVESDPSFPSGEELWAAFDANQLNGQQMQVVRPQQPAEQLYDLQQDPDQLHNLADDDRYALELKRLRRALDQWTEETGDTIPDNPTPDRYLSIHHRAGTQPTNPDFKRGEFPGAVKDATMLNHSGPIRRGDVGDGSTQ